MSADPVFDAILDMVSELVDMLREVWDLITEAVNIALTIVTRNEANSIKSEFDKTASEVSEVFDTISKTFTERGSATALRDTANVWNEEVAKHASRQAGLLQKEQLETDNEWSGDAADRYGEAVISQNKALTQIKAIVDTLGQTLNDFASALTSFWEKLLWWFVGYVVAIGAAIATILTGAGAVAGLIIVATASVAFITNVTEITITYTNTVDTQKANLDRQRTMDGTFPDGVWPPAVTDMMSDASVKDGDKSDWTPKP